MQDLKNKATKPRYIILTCKTFEDFSLKRSHFSSDLKTSTEKMEFYTYATAQKSNLYESVLKHLL